MSIHRVPTVPSVPPTISVRTHDRPPSAQAPRSPASPCDPLSTALAGARSRYTIANSKSLIAHNEACKDLPGGNTRTVLHSNPFPMTIVQGLGCDLTSLDGDIYIDFLSEFTAGLFGHSNGVIAAAVSDALKSGWNYGGPNLHERQLASKVTKRFGLSGIEIVRFTNSGTESNTMAIAAAKAFTNRSKVLVFRNGYHGGTLSFPSNLAATNVNLPHDFVIAPFNDIPGTREILSGLPPESLAAILVEPIQGSGGCIVGDKDFLHFLNNTAHMMGAMFIVDEVMTSRLSYHGLSAYLGLKPDLVTMGKWVGGGMTFGAFGGRKDGPMMMFDPRDRLLSHSGTFNNNIITMAAGCAGLDLYTEAEVVRLNGLGEKLKQGIEKVLQTLERGDAKNEANITQAKNGDHGIGSLTLSEKKEEKGMWIAGFGSILAFHFSGESQETLKGLLWHHLLDNEIYMAQRGFVSLNLELNEKHIEKFVDAVEDFVKKYEHALTW